MPHRFSRQTATGLLFLLDLVGIVGHVSAQTAVTYDKFRDQTTISTESDITSDKLRTLALFVVNGSRVTKPPKAILLTFVVEGSGWQLMRSCPAHLCEGRALLDGERVSLGKGEWKGDVISGGVVERVAFGLSLATFTRLAKARRVELQIQPLEFDLPQIVLKRFRHLLDWTTPAGWASAAKLQATPPAERLAVTLGMSRESVAQLLGTPDAKAYGWFNDVHGERWTYIDYSCVLDFSDSDGRLRHMSSLP